MPEYTKSRIADMAAGHCKSGVTIDDLDNESTAEAIQARRWFDHVTQFLMENYEWPFATRLFALEKLENTADVSGWQNHWGYRYKFPSDCVKLHRIQNPAIRIPSRQEDEISFRVADQVNSEGKVILCDEDDAVAEGNHSSFLDNVDLWDVSFAEAHALYLAFRMSPSLNVSDSAKRDLFSQWQAWQGNAIERAKEHDEEPDPEPPSAYQQARS